MNTKQVNELLYQALETEIGGQDIYKAAIKCAQDPNLQEEWTKYLEQTEHHEQVLRDCFAELSLDASIETPGRRIVRHIGESLIAAMAIGRSANAGAAEIFAAECVVLAETKDHQNWTLLQQVANAASGKTATAIKRAVEEVEDEEDEHLYHTMGWARELWIDSLGMPAVLPPPEEEKSVKTAIGAARAAQARKDLL